jgi:hypothetical protein
MSRFFIVCILLAVHEALLMVPLIVGMPLMSVMYAGEAQLYIYSMIYDELYVVGSI